MGLVTYLIRVGPQLFLGSRSFPDAFECYLRYVAYALIASIISTSLFLTGARFEGAAAPYRGVALIAAILIAHWSGKPLLGMFVGALLALAFSIATG